MQSGITRRWLRGGLLLLLCVVAAAEILFITLYNQRYYTAVRQSMGMQFSAMVGQLNMYTGENEADAVYARSMALRRMVEQFAEKDKYEFMLLDAKGQVLAASGGVSVQGIVQPDDFTDAQTRADGLGSAVYTTATGEEVMAACMLLPFDAGDVAGLRLVTSLTLVNERLGATVVISALVVVLVMGIAVLSGLYFVRSIVQPLGEMERMAAGIAAGDLSVRLPAAGDARDEIDRLSVSINRMAEGLAQTEQIKNEFISSVSHELRTPLTSIKGWVETMQAIDDPADANYRKGLDIIHAETERLYAMVEELLDFSRLQSGRLPLQPTRLDLVAEVTDAVLFMQPGCIRQGIGLVYDEPEAAIPVMADPDRLRQVFINVVDNAMKYSRAGGRISVKVWAGKQKAFVEIIDQGRGISAEDLANVRSKFYKGKNAIRGSGIGLALVDEIMTALGGTLDIRSVLGRGTVVTLGLPLHFNEKRPPAQQETK